MVIEAIKKAEKSDATIVRLYEAANTRGAVKVKSSLSFKNAQEVDLMERNATALDHNDGAVNLRITPFQIRSISLT